jgi:hypothetical protein
LYDRLGEAVAGGFDFNGDGFDDLLLGAPFADPYLRSRAGQCLLLFGNAEGFGETLPIIDVQPGQGVVINGEVELDYAGTRVSSAGDVDGDGFDDILIGAPEVDGPNAYIYGQTYLIFGGEDVFSGNNAFDLRNLTPPEGMRFLGSSQLEYSGKRLTPTGDMNGDGLDDFAIASFNFEVGAATDAGRVYLVFGNQDRDLLTSGGLVVLNDLPTSQAIPLDGIGTYDRTGRSISGAGDVNGDGFPDLLIGSALADPSEQQNAGESYLVFGGAHLDDLTTGLALQNLNGTNGVRFGGEQPYDWAGYAVSGAGDVNGDGFADLLIGAYRADPMENRYAGSTYLVLGRNDWPTTTGQIDLQSLTAIDGRRLDGRAELDFSGFTVAGAEDINRDGYDDFLIGGHGADPDGKDKAGEAYLVYGGPGLFESTERNLAINDLLSTATGETQAVRFVGVDPFDRAGRTLGGAGDVDRDGTPDLIISAAFAEPGEFERAGESYWIRGQSGPADEATYRRFAAAGDGPGGKVVPGIDFGPAARCAVDFPDDDLADNGSGAASLLEVTIRRGLVDSALTSDSSLLAPISWTFASDRASSNTARITLDYLDAEVVNLPGPKNRLTVYQQLAANEPWMKLPTAVDLQRKTVSVETEVRGTLVVGPDTLLPPRDTETRWQLF